MTESPRIGPVAGTSIINSPGSSPLVPFTGISRAAYGQQLNYNPSIPDTIRYTGAGGFDTGGYYDQVGDPHLYFNVPATGIYDIYAAWGFDTVIAQPNPFFTYALVVNSIAVAGRTIFPAGGLYSYFPRLSISYAMLAMNAGDTIRLEVTQGNISMNSPLFPTMTTFTINRVG